jgi:hypothetical protein
MTRALLGFIAATAAYGLALALSRAEMPTDVEQLLGDILAGTLAGTACLLLL